MKYLIPSYRRHNSIKTTETLLRLKIEPQEITIGVQTEDDFKSYNRALGSRFNVVFENATNLSGNYNNLLKRNMKEKCVFLIDDDIRSIRFVEKGGRSSVECYEEVKKYMIEMERIVLSGKSNIVTAYASSNSRFAWSSAEKNGDISKNYISSGWIMEVNPSNIRFDENLDAVEDYEVQLREISKGRDVYRCNRIIPITRSRTKKNGNQEGGRGFCYEDKNNVELFRKVEDMYFPIAKFSGTSIRLNRRLL